MPASYTCPKDGNPHELYNHRGKTYCSKCGALIALYPIAREKQEPAEKGEEEEDK